MEDKTISHSEQRKKIAKLAQEDAGKIFEVENEYEVYKMYQGNVTNDMKAVLINISTKNETYFFSGSSLAIVVIGTTDCTIKIGKGTVGRTYSQKEGFNIGDVNSHYPKVRLEFEFADDTDKRVHLLEEYQID